MDTPHILFREAVAGEVRAAMARRCWTQVGLAHEMGMSVNALRARLSGRKALDMDDLALIAAALDVPLHTLLPDTHHAA